MTGVILAAGYATRLYPLTLNTPKCLLEVSGRTILDSLCDKLNGLPDLKEIVIVTNAKFFDQLCGWRKKAGLRVPVRIMNDGTLSNDTRLGAIGDLQFAIKECRIEDDILMLASDNLFDADLTGFANFVGRHPGEVCVGLHDIGDPRLASKKYGVLEIDASSKVTRIEEKPEFPRSSLIGMGIYYFPKKSLSRITEYLKDPTAKDAPGFYIHWLTERQSIFGFLFPGLWYDIGDLASLEEANRVFKPKTLKKS